MHQVFPVEKEDDPNQEGLVDGRRQRFGSEQFFWLAA